MTTVDPGMDYATDAEAEKDLFGNAAPPQLPLEEEPAAPPPAAPRRRAPGPPPNPHSKRQQKLRAADQRARTQPAPPRKATPNKPAPKSDASEVYRAGAVAVIGWAAQPLAAAGLGMRVAAAMPRTSPAKAAVLARHSMALTLDSLTLAVHENGLADGLAAAAEHVPWMGQVLERAAKISPFAALTQTGFAIVFQVLCNHGIMPVSKALGTLGPEELAAAAGVPMEEPPPVG